MFSCKVIEVISQNGWANKHRSQIKSNWNHGSAHGGANERHRTAKRQQSLATIWHCLLRPFSISLPFPPLRLLSNRDGDCSVLHLRGISARSCPGGFVDGAKWWCSGFISQSTACFYWKLSSATCVGHSGPTACMEFGFHCCFHGR